MAVTIADRVIDPDQRLDGRADEDNPENLLQRRHFSIPRQSPGGGRWGGGGEPSRSVDRSDRSGRSLVTAQDGGWHQPRRA